MYLSNTRLIGLLFALAALTLGLLWLLSNQVNLTGATALKADTTEEPLQLAANDAEANTPDPAVTAIPELDPVQEPAAARAIQTEATSTLAATQAIEPSELAASAKSTPTVSTSTVKPVEVAAVPEHLMLSEKELKALSAKDRKRYEKMLKNLSSVRDQSSQLSTERQRLEQQMQALEQRNLELTRQLEQVRQTSEMTAENKVKP
ncbi:hypothetical protein SAMN02745130_03023 [Thiothrix eikelboomii]|uniref:Uncharacterized protein n=1 Tax=Thiothrix eikelboomii TaxID=92487 RepID=A0A1T4XI66_9GAMM|nr:hypothetical protein [Thiothrix eikelboomii]SKA89272.1 hypothetical protein SAMN02745130_03023 [Thiothrix eikelboomii]